MGRPDLAIIIPAWNEENTIKQVVSQAINYGKVILVDDASTDATKFIAREAGAHVVSHESNQGYDKSLSTGFSCAYKIGCKYAVTMDADGQHNPDLINEFIDCLIDKNIPLVIGKRKQKVRVAESLMGLYFKIRFNVSDILCGMKGYHMKLWEQNNGFDHIGSIGAELSFMSLKRGYDFVELNVPIRHRQEGHARFGNSLKGNITIMYGFIKIVMLDIIGKSILK